MKPVFFSVAAVLALLATGAVAQTANTDDSKVEVSPGKVQYYSKLRREATVTSINQSTREVSLLAPDGETVSLTAGPEVRNLASVKVGDKVVADYQESIEVTLLKKGKQPVGRREEASDSGKQATSKVVLTGDVIKVDKATGIVTLRGATRTVDMTVMDPKQLERIKVGDQVQAVTTQTLALSLEPAS
ncbi:copper-binding protein [Sphingomonas sp. LaA6.9]|uniref:copper-binding protein n=1 Tax=Sphingomonas sp. LaA6.9 TaxID=2919914 RepID=UPI001F5039F4|nr:copper-binding protein [Sphingomonas sp. LaA6.9]MCJ8157854.1 copper-binding protein [Sphingomonas sp. LaA6.9]